MLWAALLVPACYLIGSIPFPVFVSRFVRGIDLREHGSGNMGAMNAGRVLGKRWAVVVFLLDALKGAAAVLLARELGPAASPADALTWACTGGMLAVLGHCYPIFAGFRGGVGLATSAGGLLMLSLPLTAAALAAIGFFWLVARDMYMGVTAGAFIHPVFSWLWLRVPGAVAVMTVWALVVVIRHYPHVLQWLELLRIRRRPGE